MSIQQKSIQAAGSQQFSNQQTGNQQTGNQHITMQSMTDKLFTIRYKCDDSSHLSLKDERLCVTCIDKSCNFFCPAEVYHWEQQTRTNRVAYENCVECGTCRIACPSDNVAWHYPKGGYGITYRFG